MIGPVVVTSEASIGAGTRRIFAVTGPGALALSAEHRRILDEASRLLKVEPEGLIAALEKASERQRQAEKELAAMRSRSLDMDAAELTGSKRDGVVVARRDGLGSEQLRDLAQAVRRSPGIRAVLLGGTPDGEKVALAASTDGSVDAAAVVKQAASTVGGGGGGTPEVAVAGGRDVTRIDEALGVAAKALGLDGQAP
jgi:alanyl-tRNA synthetase